MAAVPGLLQPGTSGCSRLPRGAASHLLPHICSLPKRGWHAASLQVSALLLCRFGVCLIACFTASDLATPDAALAEQRPQPSRTARLIARAQSGGGLGEDDVDVAVFRFTLGIPGFEDRLIPRVLGIVGAALLAINHVLSVQPEPDAQVRAEFVVLALCAVCVLVPEIEERLKEALPGRGRQRMADNIEGAANGFLLKQDLSETVKRELAWSSVSLIKNTNSCGVLVVRDGQVVMARGALATAVLNAKEPQASLTNMTKDLAGVASSSELAAALQGQAASSMEGVAQQAVYLQDKAAMSRAQTASWASLPKGVQSVLVQALPLATPRPSFMLLYAERPRALSDKERRWAAAIASKLAACLA